MSNPVRQIRVIHKIMRSLGPRTLFDKLNFRGKRILRGATMKGIGLTLRSTDSFLGLQRGSKIFWQVPYLNKWTQVDQRLRQLHARSPEHIEDFVRLGYAQAGAPEIIVNLARSALSKEIMRDLLAAETLDPASPVRQRMIKSDMMHAAYVAAATILLDDDGSRAFIAKAPPLSTKDPVKVKLFRRMIDSCGVSLVNKDDGSISRSLIHSGFRKLKKHRLVVARSFQDVPTVSLLFDGAEEVTLFVMDDLYGRIGFTDQLAHAGSTRLNVEHCRTRITRFSPDYHRIHTETRTVAESLITALDGACGHRLPLDDFKSTAMALADNIFFPCLQFTAMERLMQSDEFDHVVIALGGAAKVHPTLNKRFAYLVSGVEGFVGDPRMEMVCLSPCRRSLEVLEVITGLLSNSPPVPLDAPEVPHDFEGTMDIMREKAELVLDGFGKWPASQRPRVLLATSQVTAYNRSSAEYAKVLASFSDLRVAFVGGNLMSFSESVKDAIGTDALVSFPDKRHAELNVFQEWLMGFVRQHVAGSPHQRVAHVISSNIARVAYDGITSFMMHSYLCDAWFSRLAENGQLPKAVVLTPFRSTRVSAFAHVAERHGVPSIAVEPHGLNATYCRYTRITADFYGSVSKFFAGVAVEGYGMSPDRSPVIGSPRLKGPDAGYDIVASKADARAQLGKTNDLAFDHGTRIISYFTQPSDWKQISEVWRIILEATRDQNCFLLVKTHPEEGSSREKAYLDIAREMGAIDRIRLVTGDATAVIEAADLVMSGYSATVVETALHRRPVFCVTNGDTEYPLNQHEVIGGPVFRNAADLAHAVRLFIEDPDPYYANVADFLKHEPQLISGFETYFRELVEDVIAMPPEQAVRPGHERPDSLFMPAPHPVFNV